MTEQEYQDLKKIFDFVKDNTNTEDVDGNKIVTTTLDPINISMVAPRAAGKTSLLATLFKYMKEHINPDNFEITIDEDSEIRIKEYTRALQVIKDADSNADITSKISNLQATNSINEFKFTIRFKHKIPADSKTIIVNLPFCVMDVAGGIVAGEVKEKTEEFKAHLKNSSVLLIPFDSMLLMQKPITDDQDILDRYISDHMSIDCINEWGNEWAQSRKNDNHPKAVFVAMKSETYHTHRVTEAKTNECFNNFSNKYKEAVHKLINKAPSSLEITYTPLETIGCIQCVHSTFENGEMSHKFLKKDNIPDYLGTGVVLDVIFKRAKNQIDDVYGDAKKWIDEIQNRSWIEKMKHPIDWLDSLFNKNFVLDFYNGIGEIEKELTNIAKKDSCFTKGFNKII